MAKKRVRGLDGFGSEVDAFPLPGCCVITLGWGFFSIEWEQPLLVVNYVNTHGGWEWGKHTHTHTLTKYRSIPNGASTFECGEQICLRS